MIGHIKGIVESITKDSVLIDVGGVGYLAFCSASTLSGLAIGQTCKLKILTHVREDHIHLFGFAEEEEKAWFDLLIGVQGVGPKMALSILSSLRPHEVAGALALEDKAPFQSISGVGPKLAARLVTELKQKTPTVEGISSLSQELAKKQNTNPGPPAILGDLISALQNLGYDEGSARHAAHTALRNSSNEDEVGLLIPIALKVLAP